MSFEHLFEVWAPPESRWSPWVKPVLFAIDAGSGAKAHGLGGASSEFKYVPKSDFRTALVIDCPGDQSLRMGIAAARAGFRPVPLFNACHGPREVVSLAPLIDGLPRATALLREASLSPESPPAFLLDARRMRPERTPQPGDFDNRWLVFPQDFPSGNFLLASGIDTLVLVQMGQSEPQQDLAHVLLRWQKAGLSLQVVDINVDATPRQLSVPKPRWYGWLWAGLLIGLGLRMHGGGGFGAVIPQPSSGGGYG